MVLCSARDTAFLVLSGTRRGRRPTCPFGERESLKRFLIMGPLPTESVLWSQAEDT